MKKSFRDPITNALKAHGYMSSGDVGDLSRDEPDGFNLEPGKWQLVGDAWQPYEPPVDYQAQIDAIERQTLTNRGAREGWIALIRKEAAAQGITDDAAIAADNPFFNKLLEVDRQIRALRSLLP